MINLIQYVRRCCSLSQILFDFGSIVLQLLLLSIISIAILIRIVVYCPCRHDQFFCLISYVLFLLHKRRLNNRTVICMKSVCHHCDLFGCIIMNMNTMNSDRIIQTNLVILVIILPRLNQKCGVISLRCIVIQILGL